MVMRRSGSVRRRREVKRLRRGRPRDWRDIDDAREWETYRLATFRTNLAVGAMLRELRRSASVSQREVFERLNVSQTSVSSWEAGRSKIPDYRVAAFRRAIVAAANRRAAKVVDR